MLMGFIPAVVGASSGLSAVTLINRGSLTTSTSDLSTYTFSSQAIGTASTTRRVVVAVHCGRDTGASPSLSSATIGGVSATIHATQSGSGGGFYGYAAIISATVPTGTTADVVLNLSATSYWAGITVIAIDGLNSTTPTATATDNTLSSGVLSNSLTWSADGFVIAAATFGTSSSTTWATSVTERWDSLIDSVFRITGADLFATTGSSETVSATSADSSPNGSALVMAAFR
jgi:hypothetical protein